MSLRNDLHATHQIIQLFERAKAQSEMALDALPGVYAVIDSSGLILKGNKNLAKLFNANYEYLLNMQFSELFTPEIWEKFKSRIIDQMQEKGTGVEFELDVVDKKGATLNYTWNITRQKINNEKNDQELNLFAVLGRDVTEFKQVNEQKGRMEVELSTARTVQDTLFPPMVAQFGKSEISGFYEPASECGGDWWYYCTIGEKVFLWIGDVTGHGVPAALVTSAVRSAVSIIESEDVTPSQALSLLCRAIFDTAKGHKVMTFFIAAVDLNTGDCSYSRAGHEPVFLVPNKEGLTHRDLDCLMGDVSPPLGVDRTVVFQQLETKLNPGDRLFFYTDGIYDIRNPAGKIWGQSAFVRKLAKIANLKPDAHGMVQELLVEIRQFRQDTILDDDVTFFVFKF